MDKHEALDVALGQIERQFGKGSVMKMNDRAAVSVGAVSTGSLALDLALGIGGLPRGRIVEIFGPESSGKTTLVYHVIAEAQRRGGICAFIDAEHAMDPAYAKRIGVDIDNLLVSQPDTGEQALEITELLIRSGALDVVAIDSVAALTPKAEIEGEMGDSHVGLQARLMSQALRKLAGTLNRTDTICLFTNQLREKIGVMFGNPETTPGGRALKFYSSVRLDIRRIETLKDGVEAFGNRVRVKVVKNKVAPPFKQAEFDIIYGAGISWEGTVLDSGLERKVVTKSGSYFSFGDERLGQGRQNATAFLREHPDVTQQILQAIQAELGSDADRVRAAAAGRRRGVRGGERQGGGGGGGARGGRSRGVTRSSPGCASGSATGWPSSSTAGRGACCRRTRSYGRASRSDGRWIATRRGSSRARFAERGPWPRRRERWPRAADRAGSSSSGWHARGMPPPRERRRSRPWIVPGSSTTRGSRRAAPSCSRAAATATPRSGPTSGAAWSRPEAAAGAVAALEPEPARLRRLLEAQGVTPALLRRLRRSRLLTRCTGRSRRRRLRRRRETR